MPLDSSSTLAEVQAAYDDNCQYDLNASVDEAKAFIAACRILIRRSTEKARHGESELWEDVSRLQAALEKAEAWWAANDTAATTSVSGGSVRGFSLENFRG